MKFLDRLFRPKPKENPFFTIFKGAFSKNVDFTESKVYHIKSFEHTELNMELFESSTENKKLFDALEKLQYNSQSNNIGVYYVINSNNQNVIYLLSDPLEVFEKEYVMKEYKMVLDEQVMSLSCVERIN